MKTKVLLFNIIAICMFFNSCRKNVTQNGDGEFQPENAFACTIETMRDFEISKLVNNKGKVNLKMIKSKTPVTISDLQVISDTVFGFALEPASSAEGLTISGNGVFVYNKEGKLNSVFFHNSDKTKVFVWPDCLAFKSRANNKDNSILITKIFDKLQKHWQGHIAYMSTPKIKGVKDLELLHSKSVYMLGENDCRESRGRFDISSLTGKNGKMYCIADKPDTRDIYEFDTLKGKFFITRALETKINTEDLDIEAVDFVGDKFIIADEIHDLIYFQDGGGFTPLKIDFTVLGEDMKFWSGNNAGIEGLTVDNTNYRLYIAKERDPRRIFVYEMKVGKLSAPFDDVVLGNDGDISDLCYENGFLYILDRQNCLVRRLNVKTKQSNYVSFRKFSNDGQVHNYHADFGMAEALWLTKDAIFIGFDNNEDPVTDFGAKVGLEKGSTKPSVFVFKRPKGF